MKSAFAAMNRLRFMISDSRALTNPAQTIFAAVRTATGDGHKYIADMYLRGVRAFIVEKIPAELAESASSPENLWFVTEDVPEAMMQLGATRHDNMCKGVTIAITGSRGKTVVKELLYQALLKLGNPVRSPRSWNSHIGVALSLWELDSAHDQSIIEVGIDGPGQMQAPMEAIHPEVGILTSITDAHDQGFGSREDKIHEKLKLFKNCRDVIFDASGYPGIVDIVRTACPKAALHPVSCTPYTAHNINMALARTVLEVLGYGRQAGELLGDVSEIKSRIDVHEGLNDCLMLFDGFTSDLRSLRDSLDYMRRRATHGRSLTVILGDLQHWYGQNIDELYSMVNNLLHDYGVSRMIGVGREISGRRKLFDPLIAKEFVADSESFINNYDIDRFNSELILIKGAPGSGFERIKDLLESPRHDTIMEINLDAAAHNFNYYRSLLAPGTGMIAMVKASAYGVGALELAKTLQSCRASYLAVAVVDEGVELRRAGITMPVLVLNPITNNYSALFDRRLEPTVFSLREYFTLRSEARRRGISEYPIHIKLDTGMHRLGFIDGELPELCRYLSDSSTLRVA
ncbi:MAG: alanine racemase, partial [Muribaculaceae bacterium]|nr:alanine racemase [Muribaculaceae bacterium]